MCISSCNGTVRNSSTPSLLPAMKLTLHCFCTMHCAIAYAIVSAFPDRLEVRGRGVTSINMAFEERKPRRGRPPGSKNKLKEQQAADSSSSSSSSSGSSDSSQVAVQTAASANATALKVVAAISAAAAASFLPAEGARPQKE
jgi:hypothetical protein